MKPVHDRAFKEWAVACEAMAEGRQILLIRKGGLREEGNTFTVNDPEFFLLPTYEHQNALLHTACRAEPLAPPAEAALADFRHIYETNVFGVVGVTNVLLPALR